MRPAEQGLHALQVPAEDIDLGLIDQVELFQLPGFLEIVSQLVISHQLVVHAFGEELEVVAPQLLGLVHGDVCVLQQRQPLWFALFPFGFGVLVSPRSRLNHE